MSTSEEIKQEMPSDEGSDGRSVKIGRELCVKIGNGFELVGSYTIRKVMETTGLKLTRVQEIYWRSVQRRMVLGELEGLIKENRRIEEIPYELVESLVKNDPAIHKILTHFLERRNILISPPIPESTEIEMECIDTGSPDRLLPGDEPDTGEMLSPHLGFVNPSHPIHPRGLLVFMKTKRKCEMDNEEEFLAHKGGFWDQVILAIKFFRQKYKERNKVDQTQSLKTTPTPSEGDKILLTEDIDYEDQEFLSDDDDVMSTDMFFGRERSLSPDIGIKEKTIVETDDFRQKSRKSRKDLHNLEYGKTHRPPWQFLNDLIPLRVSNFAFKHVNKDRHAKLNKLWKRAARWPLFTYWLMFVQTFIMIITLSVYGFAPLGYSPYTERSLVQQSNLAIQVVEKTIIPNIWAGPPRDALILLGANYGPCMRRDRLLYKSINEDREMEAMESGCCVQRDSSGCVQVATRKDCPTREQFADFIFEDSQVNTSLYTNRTVCGTSPRTCTSPNPSRDSRWLSDVITDWPICLDSSPLASNDSDTNEYLTCNITGRPCCVGIQAVCIITTQEHCDFLEGKFHDDAFLCAQVDCLGDICGLTPFFKPDNPDHVQRLGLALFLHAGIFHLLMTILFDFYVLRDIEKYLGWLSTSILYLGSGIGGNIISALFVPYSPEVGPAASIFGVISFFLVFIFYHWFFLKRAWLEMLKYGLIITLLIFIGLFPYVDNYARLGGMMFGLLFSFIHIHYITPHESVKELEKFKFKLQGVKVKYSLSHDRALVGKIVLLVSGIVVLIPLFIFSFVWFYTIQDTWDGFVYLNCVIPISKSDLCLDFGQTIRSRDIT